jgi:2-keto-4-pentenoate hydratase/2-oxohepta-3-ene-1,7-dioic acid hydratase in catechol pathway
MAGIAMGLDLTLRSVQSELKGKGLPWTRAKCFDGAAPVTDAVSLASTGIGDLADLSIELKINDQVRQSGQLADMIFDVEDLLAEITTFMSLMPGDLVFTGTPAGVGPLLPGECLALTLAKRGQESVAMENVLIEAHSMVR